MALVTTLMVIGILVLMVVAVISSVHQEASLTKSYHDEVAALYIAEAGLADVMSHLEIDTAWVDGFNRQPMTTRPGSYTVHFNQTGDHFERWHSVNNLTGATAVDGPRGPLTVPPYTAVIVVVGRAGSIERQLEAVVYSEGVINVQYPLMTSGIISLSGDVEVAGLKSLHGFERVAAGIHSNSGGGRPG
ncbi:MAG: hypothetical protein KC910_29330, partial [Candidatus Eremiobacteraeota bacterium]|nr:hypothetical protein [Candidatus Eremiobacteraeota bacterium]